MNNDILLFLQELFLRFKTKSPKFFQVWQFISGAAVLITGIPAFLVQFNIHLPELFTTEVNKVVAWASTAVLFMSLLTTQSKAVAVNSADGNLLKSTNASALPFTAKKEEKAAAKQESLPTLEESAVG